MEKREKISLLALVFCYSNGKQLKLKDGVLYRTIIDPQEQEVQQLVLPEILTERVIRSLHNDMGHQGLERTILLARSRCYWPGMYTDVEKWIKSC